MVNSKHLIDNASKQIHLRTTLVVPFVVQVVAAVGLVGWLSWRSGQQAINEITSQLRTEVLSRVQAEVERYLDSPQRLHQINAQIFRKNLVELRNPDALEKYFWEQSRLFNNLGTIAFANDRGEFVGANGLEQYVVSATQATGATLRRYAVDEHGDRGKLLQQRTEYDARTRSWYKTALAVGQPTWTEIEPSTIGQRLDVSAVYPLYNRDQTLLGILLCDLPLSGISKFLQSLKIGKTGKLFIIERNGLLVANSTKEIPFITKTDNQKPERLLAIQSKNPTLRAAAQTLIDRFGDLGKIKRSQQLEFSLQGDRQFMQVQPFQDGRGIDWLIVVVVPESDFMAQINANTRRTILLCLAALIVAVVVGLLTAGWITRPILQIAQASRDMAGGNLNQHVDESNAIIELETLAYSFNSMAGQLNQSFEALEDKNQALESANEALRLAEENYRGIFENALEGIFQSSLEGRLLKANPAMARIYGYDSPEEIITSITDLCNQIYVDPTARDEFGRLMQEQGQVKNFEFQVYRKDRSMTWVEMDARAVKDSNGQALYYEGIMQDISDRKRQKEILEAMVKQRTAQLEEVNAEIAVLNERLKSENLRMGAELDILREMQQLILPKQSELEEIDGLEIAGYMEPADEVGGDYYDVLHMDGVVTIGIGDVTGHGLESGILMVMTQTAVRTLQEMREADSVRFLDTLNRTLYKNIQRMNSDKNLTLAILNYAEGTLSISGQHEETLVVRKSGHIERVDTIDLGFPIGLDEEIADFINHTTVELEPGEGVVLYTDGIPEATDINNQYYGIERLCEVVSSHWHLSAEQIKEAVIENLRQFIGEQKVFDDITLVVIKRQDEERPKLKERSLVSTQL